MKWPTVPTWWNHVIRLVVVVPLVCVSVCATPGHPRPTPSAHSLKGGLWDL